MTGHFSSYGWSLLTTKRHLKGQYIIAVRNKFGTLQADAEQPSFNTNYNHFVISNENAASLEIKLALYDSNTIALES